MSEQPENIARLIAFFLPQFHPIPENDTWWGKGFTEWRNVTKAKPRFPGHYQPHLPADLGFYDLRVPEVRIAQAAMAQAYGIHGFCYYHYWFNGHRLLERPFEEVLSSGEPNFPFCLCWANENWTRRWDGEDEQILMQQHYGPDDDRAHIRSLAPALRDPRNIRIDGKPLFLVYRAERIPSPNSTTEIWREEARKLGIGDLFLCRVESFASGVTDPAALGFDAAVEFQPKWAQMPPALNSRSIGKFVHKAAARMGIVDRPGLPRECIYDYSAAVEAMLNQKPVPYRRFPCVTPGWDNSARRKTGAMILKDSTPEAYGGWLERVIREERKKSSSPVVFINAWNEWAEGNHLEPDLRSGHAYLEATKRALENAGGGGG